MFYADEISPRQRLRRWVSDCRLGASHQLDVFQTREVWVHGQVRKLMLCSWCGSWAEIAASSEDLPQTWSAEARAFWQTRHPR